MTAAPHGPYETERQALADPAVRAVYEEMRAGTMCGASEALITDACEAAGVKLGAYDARIVLWLSGFEPQACAVIAGLIARAAAGKPGALAVTYGLAGDQGETYAVLTAALEAYADRQRYLAQCEQGNPRRERLADRAGEMHAAARAAVGAS